MDREADAYGLLAALRAGNHRFIIRLQIDRAADTAMGRGRISDVMKRRRTLLTRDVTLSARKPNRADPPSRARRHSYRRTRAAVLAVTAATVTIRRPRHGGSHTPVALRLNVVRVHEKNAGRGVDPVEWRLVTTEPIDTVEDVAAIAVLSPMKLILLQRHPDVRLRPDATIRDAMLAIAALGGHIRNNGDPRWQVLGREYEDLLLLERGAVLALGCDQS